MNKFEKLKQRDRLFKIFIKKSKFHIKVNHPSSKNNNTLSSIKKTFGLNLTLMHSLIKSGTRCLSFWILQFSLIKIIFSWHLNYILQVRNGIVLWDKDFVPEVPEMSPLKFDLNLVPHGICMLIYENRSSKMKLCFRNFQKQKLA